ncbi:hypothetical protein vseg_013890 [Gypsophila vaccaria]
MMLLLRDLCRDNGMGRC